MIEGLSSYIGIRNNYQILNQFGASGALTKETSSENKVREEFLTIFYKELLKQAFSASSLGLNTEENENNMVSSFSSDIMVEHLARQLAQRYIK